jgi:quercetin dioxygenase-like cupin family protein
MDLRIARFDQPDERRAFELGVFDVLNIGGAVVGRARYEPGWRWSTHVGAATGEAMCPVEHLGVVVSGRAAVLMEDGKELVMEAGDVFAIPGGHDSWVVGDEPYVSLHILGASEYASGHDEG